MSTDLVLVSGATGETGRYTVQCLLDQKLAVRALVHRDDSRAEALRIMGAQVVVGDLLVQDDAIRALADVSAA